MFNDIALLIKQTSDFDDIGNPIPTEEKTEVFVKVDSIYANEFFAASQAGIKAQLKLITRTADYNKQLLIEYDGERYSIYRTFIKNDNIELYLTEKAGVQN